jgi:hypothetical protein
MLGLLYIVLSSVFFGFSNAYWKKAIQNTPFLQVIFMRGLYTTSFFGLCYLLDLRWGIFEPWLGTLPDFSAEQLGLSFGLCVFSAWGLFFFRSHTENGSCLTGSSRLFDQCIWLVNGCIVFWGFLGIKSDNRDFMCAGGPHFYL